MKALVDHDQFAIPAETERRDLVCRECGYGIRVSKPPPRCPMCHRSNWQLVATGERPLGRFEARKEIGMSEGPVKRAGAGQTR